MGQTVNCDAANPTWCSALIQEGQVSPISGVVMTGAMGMALKAKLDQAVAQIEEEKRFCKEKEGVHASSCLAKLKVLREEAASREAVLQAALHKEQELAAKQAQEAAEQDFQKYVWAAGGVGAGVLVGFIGGGAAVLYLLK